MTKYDIKLFNMEKAKEVADWITLKNKALDPKHGMTLFTHFFMKTRSEEEKTAEGDVSKVSYQEQWLRVEVVTDIKPKSGTSTTITSI